MATITSSVLDISNTSTVTMRQHANNTNKIVTDLNSLNADVNSLSSTKLNASSYTAADVLTKIKTVDGAGSGLDADLLDGQSGAYYLAAENLTGTIPDQAFPNWATPAVTAISNANLNTATSGGWQQYLYGTTNTNLPVAGQYFYIFVMTYSTGKVQVAYPSTPDATNGNVYIRRYNGTTWTSWRKTPWTDEVALLAGATFTGSVAFNAGLTGTTGTFSGTVSAATFSGSGASLTSIPAAQLTGTVASARITGSYTGFTSITGSGTATFATFSGSGASLTNLPAGQLTGTIADARISGAYTGLTDLTGSGTATFATFSGTTGTLSGTLTGSTIRASGTGSATAPLYSFTGDTNTGIWNSAADTLALVSGGTNRLTINNTTATFAVAISGTTGTFSGAVSGTTGTFSGVVSGASASFSGDVAGTTGTFSSAITSSSTIKAQQNFETNTSAWLGAPGSAGNIYLRPGGASSTTNQLQLTTTNLTVGGQTIWTAGNDGAGSGLDADLLDGQQGSYYLNADNMNAGTLADARMPPRLGASPTVITDWNDAIAPGWYKANAGLNAPSSSIVGTTSWVYGVVHTYASTYCIQQVWAASGSLGSGLNTQSAMRIQSAGTWSSWFKVMITQDEMDARYAQLAGDTFSGAMTFSNGLSLGSSVGSSATDLSKHIKLYASSYGFSVTGSALNYISGGGHYWYQGSTLRASLDTSGNFTAVGSVSGSSGSFTGGITGTTLTVTGQITTDGNVVGGTYFLAQDTNIVVGPATSGGAVYLRAGGYSSSTNQFALTASTATIGGHEIWTAGTDGAGSGLDADLLDGQQGSYYTSASNLSSGTVPNARISGAYTGFTNLTGSGTVDFAKFWGSGTDTASAPSFSWTTDSNTGMWLAGTDTVGITAGGTNRLSISTTAVTSTEPITAPGLTSSSTITASQNIGSSTTTLNLYPSASGTILLRPAGSGSSTNQLSITASTATIGGHEIWTAGNDGSGSGLDADTVDGVHASSFMTFTALTTYNGIGSHILANLAAGGAITKGGSYAGSALRAGGIWWNSSGTTSVDSEGTSTLSGTWKALGAIETPGSNRSLTLFVRIS